MADSIHSDLAGGLQEMVDAEPTEAVYRSSRYTGIITEAPQQSFELLDGGYDEQIEFEWMVTAAELKGARPQKRERLTIADVEYTILTVTGRPLSDPKWYKFGLRRFNTQS